MAAKHEDSKRRSTFQIPLQTFFKIERRRSTAPFVLVFVCLLHILIGCESIATDKRVMRGFAPDMGCVRMFAAMDIYGREGFDEDEE